ncbi:MAG: DUF4124 domain-containing protein [Burkholderiales bacterium]|nr:DUF4124 domain-containing protein [Burkholderiales bacterium]
MRTLVLALSLTFVTFAVRAEIYECIDQSGNKRFTNIPSDAKGCKPMNIAPPPKAAAPSKPPAKGAPANFPSVDAQTQKQRDTDRRRILEQELASEQKLLEQAQKDLAEQEVIRLGSERNYQRVLDRLEPFKKKVKLHEDNIASLKKELANTR